jgi:hypothetical protein
MKLSKKWTQCPLIKEERKGAREPLVGTLPHLSCTSKFIRSLLFHSQSHVALCTLLQRTCDVIEPCSASRSGSNIATRLLAPAFKTVSTAMEFLARSNDARSSADIFLPCSVSRYSKFYLVYELTSGPRGYKSSCIRIVCRRLVYGVV